MEGEMIRDIVRKPFSQRKYRLELLKAVRVRGFENVCEEIHAQIQRLTNKEVEEDILRYLHL